MKAPTKSTTTTEQPAATDTLVNIVEAATLYRFHEASPNLAAIVRMVGLASRVLYIKDKDERSTAENAAVMLLAKKRGLIS